jgi:hypothetical protein
MFLLSPWFAESSSGFFIKKKVVASEIIINERNNFLANNDEEMIKILKNIYDKRKETRNCTKKIF